VCKRCAQRRQRPCAKPAVCQTLTFRHSAVNVRAASLAPRDNDGWIRALRGEHTSVGSCHHHRRFTSGGCGRSRSHHATSAAHQRGRFARIRPATMDVGAPGLRISEAAPCRYHVHQRHHTSPSDSFPGLISMVTGGTPKSTGVFYDDSYSRDFFAPGTRRAAVHPARKRCTPRTWTGPSTG